MDLGFASPLILNTCLQIVRCRCMMDGSLQKCSKTGLRLARSRSRFGAMRLMDMRREKPALRRTSKKADFHKDHEWRQPRADYPVAGS